MTKLSAVQRMFELCGLAVPPALATGGVSTTGRAETILDEEDITIQGRAGNGWKYNTRTNVQIAPTLPAVTNGAWTAATKRVTQAGAFTQAAAGQSFTFTAGITGTSIVTQVDTSGNFIVLTDVLNATDVASGVVGAATNGRVFLPDGCITIDTCGKSESRDLVQVGGLMYDRENNTDIISVTLYYQYVLRFKIECIPQDIAEHIVAKAAMRLLNYTNQQTNRLSYRMIDDEIMRTKAAANRFNARMNDVRGGNDDDRLIMRGFRTEYNNWVAPFN